MNRTTSKSSLGFSLSLALGLLTAVPAIAQLGVAERAGEALDNAGRNIRRGVETAIERGRAPIYDRQLLARVFGRVQWDKALIGSALDLEVRDEGTVILRGGVVNTEAKDRAVLLAKDTIGVTQVIDELTILPPARVIPAGGPAATIRIRPARVAPAVVAPVVVSPAAPVVSETTTTTTVVKPARVVPLTPPSAEVIVNP